MQTTIAPSQPESCGRIARKSPKHSSGEVSLLNRSRFHTVCKKNATRLRRDSHYGFDKNSPRGDEVRNAFDMGGSCDCFTVAARLAIRSPHRRNVPCRTNNVVHYSRLGIILANGDNMTGRTFRLQVIGVIVVVFVVSFLSLYASARWWPQYGQELRAVPSVLLAIGGAWLAFCWQRRVAFTKALFDVWQKIVVTVQDAI